MRLTLADKKFHLPYDAFFQVNTAGTELLIDILSSIYAEAKGKLFDLYCGVGTLEFALSKNFDLVLGIEVHEGAIEVARKNAHLNQVDGEWHAGSVETLLHHLQNTDNAHILVDPPRVGLHPKAAQKLAECMAKAWLMWFVVLLLLQGTSPFRSGWMATKKSTPLIFSHKPLMSKALRFSERSQHEDSALSILACLCQ